jgi:hypothetical protein
MTYCELKKRDVWFRYCTDECQDIRWQKGEKQFYVTDCVYMREGVD